MPIIDYTPSKPRSAYAELVETELTALKAAGEGKASQFVIPTADINKVKVAFSQAANAAGFTARYKGIESETDKAGEVKPDGNTTITVVLGALNAKAGKLRKDVTETDGEMSIDGQ